MFGAAYASVTEPLTYAEHIAPILRENCLECHQPGGQAPFSLLHFEDVQKRARQIAEVTASGFMPPWKPSADHGPKLQGERRLTPEQIERLRVWSENGALPGALDQLPPPPPTPREWALGEPDLVLSLGESYWLPAAGKDVYRNFVLKLPASATRSRYVRAVEFLPGPTRAIHHALLAVDHHGWAAREDAKDPRPGFAGMELRGASSPSGHLIGWTAGQVPFQAHPGTAWELESATQLVLQLHLVPTGKREPIAPRLGFYFSDQPPERKTHVLVMRTRDMEIPPGVADYTVEETFQLPVRAAVVGLYPHAHYLGKDLQIYADLPGGGRRWLLRIEDWDFAWQRDYRFVEPPELPAGATLTLRYVFDNTAANPRNPSRPPVTVRQGWRSTDEMAELAVQLLPVVSTDEAALQEADLRYHIAAMGRPRYLLAAAEASEARGDQAEARRIYEQSLKEDPSFAPAMLNLGLLAEQQNDLAEAEAWFFRAMKAGPASEIAVLNYARVLKKRGELDRAHSTLVQWLKDTPEAIDARLLLYAVLTQQGREADAVSLLRDGLAANPASDALNLEMAKRLARERQTTDATQLLERVIGPGLGAELAELPLDALLVKADALMLRAVLAQQAGQNTEVDAMLEEILAQLPAHRGALLLSATRAARRSDEPAARRQLLNLLKLQPTSRPSHDELLDQLPFPTGARALIRACHERDEREVALALLQRVLASPAVQAHRELHETFVRLGRELGLL